MDPDQDAAPSGASDALPVVAGYNKSPHSPVANPYEYPLESDPPYLYLYTNPNQPWNRNRYSFSSSTNEPNGLIRQDVPPTATNETTPPPAHVTPPELPKEIVREYIPLATLSKVSAVELPILRRDSVRRERTRGSLCTMGNTPLDPKPTSCADEMYVPPAHVSAAEPGNSRVNFEKLDSISRRPTPLPLRSVINKSHLFDLKGRPVERNPYAIKPRSIRGDEIEMVRTVIKTESAPERTASAKKHGHQLDSAYAPGLTPIAEDCHSRDTASIRSASLDLGRVRHRLHIQFLSDEIRADDNGVRVDEVPDDAQQTSPNVDLQDRHVQDLDAETLQDTSATRLIRSGNEHQFHLPVYNDIELRKRYSHATAMSRILLIIGELAVQLRDLNSEIVAIGGTDPRRALNMISLIEQSQGILMGIIGRSDSTPTTTPSHDQFEHQQSNRASEMHTTSPQESQEILKATTNWDKLCKAKRDAANGDLRKAIDYLDELMADIEKICPRKAKSRTCEARVKLPPQDRDECSSEQAWRKLNEGISQMKEGSEAKLDVQDNPNRMSDGSHGDGTTTGPNQAPISTTVPGQHDLSGFPTWVDGVPFVHGQPSRNDLASFDDLIIDPNPDLGLRLLLDYDGRPLPNAERNFMGRFSIVQRDDDGHFFTIVRPNHHREVFLNLPPGFSVTPKQNVGFVVILAPAELPSSTASEIEEYNRRYRLEEEQEANVLTQRALENPPDTIERPLMENTSEAVDSVDENIPESSSAAVNREASPARSIAAPAPETFWSARHVASGQPYLEHIDRKEADRLADSVDRSILQMHGPDAIVYGAHVWRPGEDTEMDKLWEIIRKKWSGRTVRDV
jgi:hypothetical protein